MFNDFSIACKSIFGLSRTLMVATMVKAIGTQYVVVTANDHNSPVTAVNKDDPYWR